MATVVLQEGHVARKTGRTGTWREQEAAIAVATRAAAGLKARGHTVLVVGADDPIPTSDAFVAIHTDGSTNKNRRGASVGYPNATSARLAAAWKRRHQAAGYPGGFHADNYTPGLAGYYGFGKAHARFEILTELATTTNPADEQWLFSHLDAAAAAIVEAISEVVGDPHPPHTEALVTDPTPTSHAVDSVELTDGTVLTLAADGAVYSEPAGAHYYGGPLEPDAPDLFAPAVQLVPADDEFGYWIVSAAGEIHAFGSALAVQPYVPLFQEYKAGARSIATARRARRFAGLVLTSNLGEHYERPV